MSKTTAKGPSKAPTKAAIRRSVASSTAIATGQNIGKLERHLWVGSSKFRHLSLAD